MKYFQENADKFDICFEAQNGVEALELLRKNSIDVVLTDIRMPFIDGIELLKKINSERLCRCVILLSEFAEFSYAKAGILNGAFDYVLKPIDDEKVLETFERAYNYLSTISGAESAEHLRVEALAGFVLADDRVNAMAYANHLEADLHAASDEWIVPANDALRLLCDYILKEKPYLSYYVDFGRLSQIDAHETAADHFVTVFAESVLAITDAVSPFLIHSKNPLAVKTCLTVLERGGRSVMLRDIAAELFVSPKYLGALFKKELGQTFGEYTTFVRMSRAKQLLADPTIRIYEVAEALGYEDVDYFSKVFKALTSVTPSDYRGG